MDDKICILVVEDEPKIRQGLKDFLDFHGFCVSEAHDGLEAERLVSQKRFHVILLDLMLPKISGEQLCTQWRERSLETPIIMLTAKGREEERIKGLQLGADDYIPKPFSLEELLARIEAVLRRTHPSRSVGQTFDFGGWEVDIGALKVHREGVDVEISAREAQIIQYFAANPGRVVSRDQLYETVWGEPMSEIGTRTVDVHIAKLRSKVEKASSDPQIIKTVRGAGYLYALDQ